MKTESREALLQCPTCRNVLSVNCEVMALEDECPVCRSAVDIRSFPRLFREPVRQIDTQIANETESSCTFFPDLKAEKVCDECGCLMSSKATIVWSDEEVCLPCLYRLREEEKAPAFIPKTSLNDNRALALVTLLAPLSLFTAPLALFLLFKHRKKRSSLFPRGRWRWWLAMILAFGWILVWTAILVAWASLILEELR